MFEEIVIQTYQPEMIQEQVTQFLRKEMWQYRDKETNELLPFSVEKSYFNSCSGEGYSLWDNRQQSKQFVGFFEQLEDARDFITNAYSYLKSDYSTPVPN